MAGLSASGQDDVSAKLNDISRQIAELKTQLGDAVFQLQVEQTRKTINLIQAAQADFQDALKQNLSTAAGKKAAAESTTLFLDKAKELETKASAGYLHDALTSQQPEGAPPLLPGVRRKIGGERFFTSANSERLRRFFTYYEWRQTALATVLSEYHTYNEFAHTAGRRVREIQDNLKEQRQYLPPKYLGDEPLRGQVFIDSTTKQMWGVNPTYQNSRDITGYGTFSFCGSRHPPPAVSANDYPTCRLNATNQFAGYSGWRAPITAEAKKLFANHPGDALSWLKTMGVNFYNEGFPISLWLRDGWRTESVVIGYKNLWTQQLVLRPGEGGPYKDPQENFNTLVAQRCKVAGNAYGNNPQLPAVPSCASPATRTDGYILWVRDTTLAERTQVCGSTWEVSPVLQLPTRTPTEVKAPSSIPSLCTGPQG